MSDTPILRQLAADWAARRTEETAMSEHHDYRFPPGWAPDSLTPEGPAHGPHGYSTPVPAAEPSGWPPAWTPPTLPAGAPIESHLDDVVRGPVEHDVDPSGLVELRGYVDRLDGWLRERGA